METQAAATKFLVGVLVKNELFYLDEMSSLVKWEDSKFFLSLDDAFGKALKAAAFYEDVNGICVMDEDDVVLIDVANFLYSKGDNSFKAKIVKIVKIDD